ncbi:MAG: lysylphosphatidylglycerol synthase domain-containing protein, partial [Armatimonadota bacterium]
LPGKVFIVVVRMQVAARYGVPRVPVAGSIVLETLLRNLMATVIAGVGLYHIGVGMSSLLALAIVAVISLVFAHPRVFHAIGDWVLRKLGHEPLPRHLRPPQVLGLLACYLLYWGLFVTGFYLMLEGTFGVEPAIYPTLATAVCITQIGSTLAVFAPVGLGAVEATMAGVLALTGAVSAPYMVALLYRVWRTVAEMAEVGLVTLVTLPAAAQNAPLPAADDGADAASGASAPES